MVAVVLPTHLARRKKVASLSRQVWARSGRSHLGPRPSAEAWCGTLLGVHRLGKINRRLATRLSLPSESDPDHVSLLFRAKAPPPAFAAAEQRRRSGGVPPPPASNPAGSDSAVRITRPPWRRDDAPPQPSVGGGAGGGAGADATSRPSSALRKSSSEGGGAGGSRSVRFAADEDASAKRPGKGRKKQTKKPKGGAKQALGPAPAPAKGTTLWHPDTLRCLQPHAIMPDAQVGCVFGCAFTARTLPDTRYLLQPIRALCFDTRGSHMAVGTNSRALRILSLPTLKTSAAVADASGAAAATAPAAAATLSKLRVDFEWTGYVCTHVHCQTPALAHLTMPQTQQAPCRVTVLCRLEQRWHAHCEWLQ